MPASHLTAFWPISEPLRASPDHNDKPRLRHKSLKATGCCEVFAEVLVLSYGAWAWKDVRQHSSLVVIRNPRDTNPPAPHELSVMWVCKLTLSMLLTHVSQLVINDNFSNHFSFQLFHKYRFLLIIFLLEQNSALNLHMYIYICKCR